MSILHWLWKYNLLNYAVDLMLRWDGGHDPQFGNHRPTPPTATLWRPATIPNSWQWLWKGFLPSHSLLLVVCWLLISLGDLGGKKEVFALRGTLPWGTRRPGLEWVAHCYCQTECDNHKKNFNDVPHKTAFFSTASCNANSAKFHHTQKR